MREILFGLLGGTLIGATGIGILSERWAFAIRWAG